MTGDAFHPADLWPQGGDRLEEVQRELAAAVPPPWRPPAVGLVSAGCFVAFLRGEQGPGHAGDRAWVGAAVCDERGASLADVVVAGVAGAPYRPGLLALREGPMLEAAVAALPLRPDVLLVDATGRDHPRRAGLALHLGAVLELPTVGVTHRALHAVGVEPARWERGNTAPLSAPDASGEVLARWVCTVDGVRPLVAHPGWRTDLDTAVEVVLRTSFGARTPEPLRRAREVARTARAG
jgi:deoxyribonuclease V